MATGDPVAPGDQNRAVREQGGVVRKPSRRHIAGRGEGSRGRIVELRAGHGQIVAIGESAWAPPVIRTLPFGRSVAVCPSRGVVISPVAVNVPGDCAIARDAIRGKSALMSFVS